MVFYPHPILLHLPRRRRHDRANLTGLLGTVCLRCAAARRGVCLPTGFRHGISSGEVLRHLFRRTRHTHLRRDWRNHMADLPIHIAQRHDRRQLVVCFRRRAHMAEIRRYRTYWRNRRHNSAVCARHGLRSTVLYHAAAGIAFIFPVVRVHTDRLSYLPHHLGIICTVSTVEGRHRSRHLRARACALGSGTAHRSRLLSAFPCGCHTRSSGTG